MLIHGVKGGAAWTWRQHDDMKHVSGNKYSWCWPHDWLPNDLPSNVKIRVIAVNYPEPGVSSDKRSVRANGDTIHDALITAGVGQRPVIWLAHSRGGLLLKSILSVSARKSNKSYCDLVNQTAGVIFLSTPHQGSPLAPIAALLHPSLLELRELWYPNKILRELHAEFTELHDHYLFPVLSIVDTKPLIKLMGLNFRAFPMHFAEAGVGNLVYCDVSHLDVCKPKDR